MPSAKVNNLIKMINQIAANICFQSSEQEAVTKITTHLQLFWAKSMKQDIIDYYRQDGEDLSELAGQAVARLAGE
ncbi:formate dehydrogenase subunit delta [Thalassomonas actiniarum]|uniref:Formate dehydrogenase subunit delta n=1 Tax=Thalassomonas actiniarum TaxID=485447 RepID=A0AAF0C1W6_9GAMM|nr:formate dehydrogenase subunit delta [Thalassomonas actiniarum]WDD99441.1 formate dehydrogenase subunit delta [Thalassomonas actiniarum]